MEAFIIVLFVSAILYFWIEMDPPTGGVMLLILVLAMLAAWGKKNPLPKVPNE